MAVWVRPAAHEAHAPLPICEYVPALHVAMAREPAGQYMPALHHAHAVFTETPEKERYLPAGHGSQ